MYTGPASRLDYLPQTLRWHAAALGLLLVGSLSYAIGRPTPALGLAGLSLLAVAMAQAVRTALGVDRRDLPTWRTCWLVALLSYLGPLVRALERLRGHLRGMPRVRRGQREPSGQHPDLDLLRRGLSVSYWNETSIDKEACLAALLEFLNSPPYRVVPDDGWQPWDLLLYDGVWLRGPIKILVENHGAEKRQIDVGMHVRCTTLAKFLTSACAIGALIATALGAWSALAIFGMGFLALEAFLGHSLYRFAHAFRDAVATAFRSLPVVALRGAAPARR